MRKVVVGLLILLVSCSPSLARLSVSPVIIEEMGAKVGQSFEIVCQYGGKEPLEIELSLALFDQNEAGNVFFIENAQARKKAREVLGLASEDLLLEPGQQEVVKLELLQADFDHLYAVLFVEPKRKGFQTRFAVLFLLSSAGQQAKLNVSSWEENENSLHLTVQNTGLRHGLWEAELLCFDVGDDLAEELTVNSGVVLAGRSRGMEITLPSWVQRVELRP